MFAGAGLVGAAVLAGGCASQCRDGTATASGLVALDEQWSAAAVKRDVPKVGSFYSEDAVVFPPGEPVVHGRAAAQKVWGELLSDPSFSISWTANDSGLSNSGDMGFTSGTYVANFKSPDGQPGKEVGKFLCIWKKQSDGSWKAVRDMWNADAR